MLRAVPYLHIQFAIFRLLHLLFEFCQTRFELVDKFVLHSDFFGLLLEVLDQRALRFDEAVQFLHLVERQGVDLVVEHGLDLAVVIVGHKIGCDFGDFFSYQTVLLGSVFAVAKPLLERALAIREQALGPNHPDTARSLNNLAALYNNQGDYEQAKPLLERALAITEQALGPNHPDTATSLNNLAELYRSQGDSEQAKPLLERALAIMEKTFGSNHPNTKIVRANHATLLENMKQKKKK